VHRVTASNLAIRVGEKPPQPQPTARTSSTTLVPPLTPASPTGRNPRQ
jgi:hypothetical protein